MHFQFSSPAYTVQPPHLLPAKPSAADAKETWYSTTSPQPSPVEGASAFPAQLNLIQTQQHIAIQDAPINTVKYQVALYNTLK